MRIPNSTYRLQFNRTFTFQEAISLVDYLQNLGITDLYSSPIATAQPGSLHGYDVLNCTQLNPEIGTEKDLEQLIQSLQSYGMGFILDIVPNHMSIASIANIWWKDVLEKGPDSKYSSYFNIVWDSPNLKLKNKVLIPVLENPYGEVLEKREIALKLEEKRVFFEYNGLQFPLSPQSMQILQQRSVNSPLEETLNHINKDLDQLDFLLNLQFYRLSYWKLANDEINYYRFFDINQLISMHSENIETFNAMHALALDYVKRGWVTGLRIDHIDGLFDPQQYIERLLNGCQDLNFYLIVEKILTDNEKLPSEWHVYGTTGYDFLNYLNGVFVNQENEFQIQKIYEDFTGINTTLLKEEYNGKKLILKISKANELYLLAKDLEEISGYHRESKDFSFNMLHNALREVVAFLPVYRTYIRLNHPHIRTEDRQKLISAVSQAKSKDKENSKELDFIQSVLLLENPPGLTEGQIIKRQFFICHFQQLTGPIMAKGFEDTALYRYYPLASLNDVGTDPGSFGTSLSLFYQTNQERVKEWPHSLLATSTHDSKRSEDVRARINVLSETPEEWSTALKRWSLQNEQYKIKLENRIAPDHNEEYLLYQTLLGTWPFTSISNTYISRIKEYFSKALKEAKIHTSWTDPDEEYERGVHSFIDSVLTNDSFIEDFKIFALPYLKCGMWNSLSQIVLKMTCPGVPDFYQGTELWEFNLVDPDNRHPVDYTTRKKMLESIQKEEKENLDLLIENLIQKPEDGRIKLYLIYKLLNFRKKYPQLFLKGDFTPLEVIGDKQNHLVAFTRRYENKQFIVLTSRFFYSCNPERVNETWKNTHVRLEKNHYQDLLTGHKFFFNDEISLSEIFTHFPMAVLFNEEYSK